MRSYRSFFVLALVSIAACAPSPESDETASDEEGLDGDDALKNGEPAPSPCADHASTTDACGVIDEQCKDQPCGTPCEGPFASPLPTACDGNGSCLPQPACKSYDCDQTHIICDIPIVPCDEGETHSVNGSCYGECVPVTSCKCDPEDPNDCPEGYVCWANEGHCGPYVGD